MMPRLLIFLDFDGVLHPKPLLGAEIFCYMDSFLSLLDEFPDIKIVISSSWRFHMNLEELESMLERHGDKLLGCTAGISTTSKGSRLKEILDWIHTNKYHGKWIALDDSKDEFPENYANLFACDTTEGLRVLVTYQYII